MKEIPVTFKSRGKQLVGIVHLPNKKNPNIILMCHGWNATKMGNPYYFFVKAARHFAKNGYAVLRFDHAGVGDSEGRYEDYNTTNSLADIQNAIKFLKSLSEINHEKLGLVGHSMGGMNVIITASKDKRVKCIASWAGVADNKDLWSPSLLDDLKRKGHLYFAGHKVTPNSVKDDFRYATYKSIRKVFIPVLIANGDNDQDVNAGQAYKLYKNAKQPKKLLIIKNADHGFSLEKHQKILFKETIKWFNKWL